MERRQESPDAAELVRYSLRHFTSVTTPEIGIKKRAIGINLVGVSHFQPKFRRGVTESKACLRRATRS